jgi:hypothetical protein
MRPKALHILPFLLALSVALFFVLHPDMASPRPPLITWTPGSISEIIGQGETKTFSVSFTSTKNIRRAALEISPELVPFVQVAPAFLDRIRKGQARQIQLILSAPPNAAPGTVSGTIQVQKLKHPELEEDDEEERKEKGNSRKALSATLPVTVAVWQSLRDAENGYSLPFPPGWLATNEEFGVNLYPPEDQNYLLSPDNYVPPSLTIRVLWNPSGVPLHDLATAEDAGWYAGYGQQTSIVVAGYEGLLFSDAQAATPREPTFAAFIQAGDRIILVTAEGDSETTFLKILERLSIVSR